MTEGRIDVVLDWRQGRAISVGVHSQRRLGVWAALIGKSVDDALRLAPLLSSICSTAHGVAGVRAVEAASGRAASPQQEALRALLVDLEVLQNHLWFWLLTAPPLLGLEADSTAFRQLRAQLAEVTKGLGVSGTSWLRAGGVEVRPAVAAGALEGLQALGLSFGFGSEVTSMDSLARLPDPTGAVFRFVMNGPLVALGRATRLATPTAAQLEPRFDLPGFVSRPTLETGPIEPGPLAALGPHPLVAEVVSAWGPGVGARLVARYVETCALLRRVVGSAQDLRAVAVVVGVDKPSGRGLGHAHTSRGPVFHRVALEKRQVVAWQVVAPTEWTFHPDGAVRDALLGLSAPDVHTAERFARWVVATLDPCVDCGVQLRER